MAWTDRLKTAAYTSPSGQRFEFLYENVSMETEKKTGTFIFPEIDGQYIQDLGRSGRRFPFVLFFSGPDYDFDSDSFLLALEEKGIGTLEHPLYGTRKVVATGTITRRDDLLTAANQAAFNIIFSETIENINFPSSELNDASDIKNAVNDMDEAIVDQYSSGLNINTQSDIVVVQNDLLDKKNLIDTATEGLAGLNEDIKNGMDIISDSLNNDIFDDIFSPGGLMDQMITLINAPSNIITGIKAQIEGYSEIINTMMSGLFGSSEMNENQYISSQALTLGSFGALSLACLNSNFENRPKAIDTVNELIDIFDNITEWMDEKNEEFEIEDTGENQYYIFQKVFEKIIGYLVKLSFELPKEVFFTLKEDRQIIELVSELYGDLEKIDFFIQTNNLTTDEIELLPMGKEIVYYE